MYAASDMQEHVKSSGRSEWIEIQNSNVKPRNFSSLDENEIVLVAFKYRYTFFFGLYFFFGLQPIARIIEISNSHI